MSIGKKAVALLLISAFFFGVTSASAAKTLDVRKVVENADNIKVGDEVAILLQFKNPFKQAVHLQIVDRNVFGNNGLDIKCLEYTLPAKEESVLTYSEPIVPFKPGNYTLDAAKVTYTNPETGKCETVESNTLNLEVNANNTLPQGQQQGITTIYQCNGTNIRSTSYSSSGSSFNIQIGGSSYGSEQQQSGGQQQESVEKRVTNNQINQNTGQLKKEMEKEMQQQKEESNNPWWLLLLIPLAGVIATGWFILDKYIKKTGRGGMQPLAVESGLSGDHVSEARRMIEEAEDLFRNDRKKDAYEKVSKAIRFYFSYKLGIKRELLNSELMNALKGRADADTCSKVNECLDLCGMVEFAKYKTNQEDFDRIVEMAKEVIV